MLPMEIFLSRLGSHLLLAGVDLALDRRFLGRRDPPRHLISLVDRSFALHRGLLLRFRRGRIGGKRVFLRHPVCRILLG